MYGKKQPTDHKNTLGSNKNPNRVTGGLKAQGVDTIVMLGEDGAQQELPYTSICSFAGRTVKKTASSY